MPYPGLLWELRGGCGSRVDAGDCQGGHWNRLVWAGSGNTDGALAGLSLEAVGTVRSLICLPDLPLEYLVEWSSGRNVNYRLGFHFGVGVGVAWGLVREGGAGLN